VEGEVNTDNRNPSGKRGELLRGLEKKKWRRLSSKRKRRHTPRLPKITTLARSNFARRAIKSVEREHWVSRKRGDVRIKAGGRRY